MTTSSCQRGRSRESSPSLKKSGRMNEKIQPDNIALLNAAMHDENKKFLKFREWKQTNTDVTITLFAGKKILPNDLNVEFTDIGVKVKLFDGRQWECCFCHDIQRTQSKTQLQKLSIILRVKKKVPGVTWSSFQFLESEVESQEIKSEIKEKPAADTTAESEKRSAGKEALPEKEEEEDEAALAKEEPSEFELNHIKMDYYEPKSDNIVVVLYVKSTKKDTIEVHFGHKEISVKFQTSDRKFLSLHEGSAESTVFRWSVNVVDSLITDDCKFKVKDNVIELTLAKKVAVKWGALEASQSKAALIPASDHWVSPTKQELSTSEKSKVERSSEKAAHWLNSQSTKTASRMNIVGEKDVVQKPTCMVSPLSKEDYKTGHVTMPGFTGLDNLGNTCFMNAPLQVLANMGELRDYFLNGQFQSEINQHNVLGSGGKLAVHFAYLMRNIWSGSHRSFAPTKLKALVGSKWNQFMGYAQHDAQEFMAFLLDGLHEDLNRVIEKPYTEQVDSDGRPDETVADEAWDVHKRRNDSFIVDLFQGQYKSKLVCPVCSKVSITFDPFMILPVPLPKKQRLLPVTFFSLEPRKKPTKFILKLSKDAKIEQLKDQIHERTKVPPKDLRVFEAHKSRVYSFFGRGASLSNVQATDDIFVFETLSEELAGEPVIELCIFQRTIIPTSIPTRCSCCRRDCTANMQLKRCSKCFKTAYCDRQCQTQDWVRHKPNCKFVPELIGQPFMISLPESKATFSQICQLLEVKSSYSVDVFQPPVSSLLPCGDSPSPASSDASPTIGAPSLQPSSLSLSEGEDVESRSEDSSPPERSRTGYVMPVAKDTPGHQLHGFNLRPCNQEGQNFSVSKLSAKLEDKGDEPLELSSVRFLAMDWKNSEKLTPYLVVHTKTPMDTEDHESVSTLSAEEQGDITLDQCLSLFTEPEVLSPEYTWFCPGCKEHREATKQLSIWRLPNTLVIQLKRFSFRNFLLRDKIDKQINFPARGLDLSKYYIGNRPSNEPPPIYDLFGVVNHHGGIMGGHYTAYARCPDPQDAKRSLIDWRLFDDSIVSSSAESQVVTRAAYVLFYRRRDVNVSLPESLPPAERDEIDLKDVEDEYDDNDMDLGGLGPPEIHDNRFADSDSEDDARRRDIQEQLTDFLGVNSGDTAACFERDFDEDPKYTTPSPSPSSFTDMDLVD
ncbi:hypothetical protein CAPTEDRAFT_224225 [Capitella teleta]|uniref:ubiquitinyl hydrolase 1 n=1 Tax=Capitella teleta TaxID=283909 RepID=R7UAD1_CAPTE|nr:hypothetical protein CAPTEDRAFT_224225 [Capitella teleta]|eukprot:ELU00773.1 hypothetical protein CAPTEDRAFT_224225 [Capitella teleta]